MRGALIVVDASDPIPVSQNTEPVGEPVARGFIPVGLRSGPENFGCNIDFYDCFAAERG
jgi:hypothetical protein